MKYLSDMDVYAKMIEQCSLYESGIHLDRWEHVKYPALFKPRFYYMGKRVGRDFIIGYYNSYKKWNN